MVIHDLLGDLGREYLGLQYWVFTPCLRTSYLAFPVLAEVLIRSFFPSFRV